MNTLCAGSVSGELTLKYKFSRERKGKTRYYWNCHCSCGSVCDIRADSLARENTPVESCGCLRVEVFTKMATKHGLSQTPEYDVWASMIERCNNSNRDEYKYYGGRGIGVCDRWMNFENFIADMGERPSLKLQIDRINNDGDYEHSNCRWATKEQQSHNRGMQANNTSGYTGVYRNRNKWVAQIRHRGLIRNVGGTFSTPLEAAIFRKQFISDNKLPHRQHGLITDKEKGL